MATCAIPSVAALAAANSMASGMPSRRRQIAAIDASSPARGEKPTPRAFILEMNNSTALWHNMWSGVSCPSAGTSSGGTRQAASPSIRSTSRLVTRTPMCGDKRTRRSARLAAASMTCSQLSSTSRRRLAPMARATDSAEISPLSFSPHPGPEADRQKVTLCGHRAYRRIPPLIPLCATKRAFLPVLSRDSNPCQR